MKKQTLISAFALGALWLGAQNMNLNYAEQYSSAGTTSTSVGTCVTVTSPQTVYTAGIFQTSAAPGIDFDSGVGVNALTSSGAPSTSDMYIVAKAGTVLNWVAHISGTGEEFPAAIIANSNAVYVTGNFTGVANFGGTTLTSTSYAGGGYSRDIFIARYTTLGALVWAYKVGGPLDDFGTNISFDASGNLLVCGSFSGTVDFDPSPGKATMTSINARDAFFARYNTSCIPNLFRSVGGTGDDEATSVVADASGALVVSGYYSNQNCDFDPSLGIKILPPGSHKGGADAFVARFTSAGLLAGAAWPFLFGTPTDDAAREVVTDATNNIYFAGAFSSGTINFSTTLYGAVALANISVLPNVHDVIIGRLTTTSAIDWVFDFGDTLDDIPSGIAMDNANHVYATGYYELNCDFDSYGAAPGSTPPTSLGRDIYVARYNTANGTYNDVDEIIGGGSDRSRDIFVYTGSGASMVALAGSYGTPTADFNTGAGVSNLTSFATSGNNAFLAIYDYSPLPPIVKGGSGTKDEAYSTARLQNSSVQAIYPNPTSGIFFTGALEEGTVVEVFSLKGEKTGSWRVTAGSNSMIDISNLSDGIYLLRTVSPGGEMRSEKLILQR